MLPTPFETPEEVERVVTYRSSDSSNVSPAERPPLRKTSVSRAMSLRSKSLGISSGSGTDISSSYVGG